MSRRSRSYRSNTDESVRESRENPAPTRTRKERAMTRRIPIASLAAGFALVFAVNATAQDLGALKNAATGSGLDMGSLTSGTAGNAAGILQFCISNNYLGGTDLTNAGSMKDKLVGKLGGQDKADADSGYAAGAQGNVIGGDGKSVSIADMGSLENKLTQQGCQAVLSHASSLL
jgi:hypothetical protein